MLIKQRRLVIKKSHVRHMIDQAIQVDIDTHLDSCNSHGHIQTGTRVDIDSLPLDNQSNRCF
jgi:hypothetical protein